MTPAPVRDPLDDLLDAYAGAFIEMRGPGDDLLPDARAAIHAHVAARVEAARITLTEDERKAVEAEVHALRLYPGPLLPILERLLEAQR